MAESVGEMMVGKMTTLFTMTDKDFDGLVSLEEFGEFNRVLEKLGKEPISSEKSTVTFDEFMELLTNRPVHVLLPRFYPNFKYPDTIRVIKLE